MKNSKTRFCPHEGPHYRVNGKGQPGLFWCIDCIKANRPKEEWPKKEDVELCEIISKGLFG